MIRQGPALILKNLDLRQHGHGTEAPMDHASVAVSFRLRPSHFNGVNPC
jgi:hypothetical protein